MKRHYINGILLLLAASVLFSACAYDAVNGAQDTSVPEDRTEESISEQLLVTTDLSETEPVETVEKVQIPDEIEASGLSKYLVLALTDYLENVLTSFDPTGMSVAMVLDIIKQSGGQPLHVGLDANDYYYACAYYRPAHEHAEADGPYCCAREYTWVKFEDPGQIPQTYQDMEWVASFQVNKASFCHDLSLTGGLSDGMEHYQPYTPAFEDGCNVAEPIAFEKSYVYLNGSSLETVYFTEGHDPNGWMGFECVEISGNYYIPIALYAENSDGSRYDYDLEEELEAYYADIMSAMVMDAYNVRDTQGNTKYYGLLSIEDLTDMICQ